MRTTTRFLTVAILVALAGCARGCGDGANDAAARDTLTQRQRDSIIGESALPGAGGVRGALRAADSAAARAKRADSIGRDR